MLVIRRDAESGITSGDCHASAKLTPLARRSRARRGRVERLREETAPGLDTQAVSGVEHVLQCLTRQRDAARAIVRFREELPFARRIDAIEARASRPSCSSRIAASTRALKRPVFEGFDAHGAREVSVLAGSGPRIHVTELRAVTRSRTALTTARP